MTIPRTDDRQPPFGPRREYIPDPINTRRCVCGSTYIARHPDPTIFDAWFKAHQGCEDGAP